MAKILCEERVVEYTKEFKVKVVELTEGLDVQAIEIADILGLHPIMVYRWRQEYREGKLVSQPTRRISMTKERPPPKNVSKEHRTENERLQKENARLKKENDLLKKWQRYLKERRGSDSGS